MNYKHILFTMTFATQLALGSNLCLAQNNDLAKQKTSSGIEFVYGGIGEGSKNSMKAMRNDYNLRMTFARPVSGEYLADVKVTVENIKNHDNTIDVVSGGPLFYTQLPDGRYKVMAEFEGKKQFKLVSIHKKLPHGIVFYFPK